MTLNLLSSAAGSVLFFSPPLLGALAAPNDAAESIAGVAAMVVASGRRRRMRWSPCFKSISARSCSFINSMSSRTFFTSNTLPGVDPDFVLMQNFLRAIHPSRRSRCQQAIVDLLRNVGENFVTRAGDQHVVLDSHTAPTGHVYSRFHGDDHPGPELGFLAH